MASIRVGSAYDVPEEIASGVHSPAFNRFLRNWFGDTTALTHGELDLSFLEDLTPDEVSIARALIRRNLGLGYTHILQGAAALRDVDAAPTLRKMLDAATSESRKLVLAGVLWNLVRDPVFIACLERAKRERGDLLAGLHLGQVLWLDDERAVDFLIDLLELKVVRNWALFYLNQLELGRQTVPSAKLPHQPDYYRAARSDASFRQKMTAAVRKWNRETKTGVLFGWQDSPAPR